MSIDDLIAKAKIWIPIAAAISGGAFSGVTMFQDHLDSRYVSAELFEKTLEEQQLLILKNRKMVLENRLMLVKQCMEKKSCSDQEAQMFHDSVQAELAEIQQLSTSLTTRFFKQRPR